MQSRISTRGLTPNEIALMPSGFISQIDISKVRLIGRTHNPFAIGKIVARGYDLYWKNYPQDFTQEPLSARSLLVHELCHVWQYATGRLTAWSYLSRPKNWIYGYEFDPRKNFDDYDIEKQADLLQDWHHMNHGGSACRHRQGSFTPSLAQINAAVPFKWDIVLPEILDERSVWEDPDLPIA